MKLCAASTSAANLCDYDYHNNRGRLVRLRLRPVHSAPLSVIVWLFYMKNWGSMQQLAPSRTPASTSAAKLAAAAGARAGAGARARARAKTST